MRFLLGIIISFFSLDVILITSFSLFNKNDAIAQSEIKQLDSSSGQLIVTNSNDVEHLILTNAEEIKIANEKNNQQYLKIYML